jgi:hypothetical protein
VAFVIYSEFVKNSFVQHSDFRDRRAYAVAQRVNARSQITRVNYRTGEPEQLRFSAQNSRYFLFADQPPNDERIPAL